MASFGEEQKIVKKKLTRLGSFSSKEVFRAWAVDSLLKSSTIETLIEVHQVDSLPAVLALRSRDMAGLGLPIGQARLFHEAVMKLRAEYSYQEPFSPATKVNVEFPRYKSMLDGKQPVDNTDGIESHFSFSYSSEVASEDELGPRRNDISDSAGTGNEKLLHKADEVEDDDETLWGCACQRWLFLSIFMPVILIISLFGFFFWIILLPFHRFCAVGKTFAKVFNGVERLVKLPLLSVQWAVGKRQPRDVEFDELQEQESRRNYGGTDDVSMNEIGKTQK